MTEQPSPEDLERALTAAGFVRQADGTWRPGPALRRLRWLAVLLALVRDASRTVEWVRSLPHGRPELLPWHQVRLVEDWSGVRFLRGGPIGGQLVEGTAYGRPFRVAFPPTNRLEPGHTWSIAVWTGSVSGTGRTEVRSACKTCSDAAGRWVTPERCSEAGAPDYGPGAVTALVQARPGITATALRRAVMERLAVDAQDGQAAMMRARRLGLVHVHTGANRSLQHHPGAACAACPESVV